MFIHFFCLCHLSLTVKLNFNISKVVLIELSENIYFIRGFTRRVTVKQLSAVEVAIWGTLIP